nr:DNA-3-methyladenine glycosylase 2 family protein [Marinicella sp. W31]MDC2878345.1 DNA-3-methyladenine glycosylase 2 family protein [Marinicella sp. W31]
MKRLRNAADLDSAVQGLCESTPAMARIVAKCGAIPLRLRPGGFEGLSEVVVGQLISKQAAAAIFARLTTACDPLTADTYLALSPEARGGLGLTRAKQASLEAVAFAIARGDLDLNRVAELPSEEAIAALVAYRGIGPWTAEVYLMFSAGHIDIFPAGDLALRAAAAHAFGLQERPDQKSLRTRAGDWRPYRAVAARILWAYYAKAMKKKFYLLAEELWRLCTLHLWPRFNRLHNAVTTSLIYRERMPNRSGEQLDDCSLAAGLAGTRAEC